MKKAQRGQSLVEFALIVPVFLALMIGLFDGTRLLFQYNELQDAARVGARWAAVNVNRDNWGTYSDQGNAFQCTGGSAGGCTTNFDYYANSSLTISGGITSTIVGQVNHSLVGVSSRETVVNIAPENYVNPYSTFAGTCGLESTTTVGGCTGMPITVTVSYTFTPILSFSMVHIPLQGRAVSYHE